MIKLEKAKIVEQKPKIRKTKDELIMENELQFQKKKSANYSTVSGYSQTSSKGFTKPSFNLDPTKMKTNSKFDEIPDDDGQPKMKMPSKPAKPSGTFLRKQKEQKEEKPLTDKLTNIAFDTKTNTAFNVERKIDRLHTEKKEVTQKPNLARYQPHSNDDLDHMK